MKIDSPEFKAKKRRSDELLVKWLKLGPGVDLDPEESQELGKLNDELHAAVDAELGGGDWAKDPSKIRKRAAALGTVYDNFADDGNLARPHPNVKAKDFYDKK